MDAATVARALHLIGVDEPTEPRALAGSASGSGVFRLGAGVLKVTAGPDRRAARRELAFYRTLAGHLPIRTPTLLRYADEELTVLLLSAHTPPPPAREWTGAEWLETARQLAALHSMAIPGGEEWAGPQWIRTVLDEPRLTVAENYWCRTPAADGVRAILGELPALGQAIDAVPPTFVHGDCHADNLLRDRGELVWSDWQAAGIGCPAGDLSFLWGRAASDGADLPRGPMLQEYLSRRPVDAEPFRRALLATQIGSALFGWPDWADHHTPDERDRVTAGMIRNIGAWF